MVDGSIRSSIAEVRKPFRWGHPHALVPDLRGAANCTLPELACARDAHADDEIGERGHALRTGGAAYLHAVPQGQSGERLPRLRQRQGGRKGAGGGKKHASVADNVNSVLQCEKFGAGR